MTTQFENSKGYMVIAVSAEEARLWPRAAACDHCKSRSLPTGFYVAADNLFLCDACYEEWHLTISEIQPKQRADEQRYLKHIQIHERTICKALLSNITTHILLK